MRRKYIPAAVLLLAIITAAGVAMAYVFTPGGMIWEPVPSGHEVGKDNGPITGDSGVNGLHMKGADCGICHTPGGPAENFVFTTSGTMYKGKDGAEPLVGAEVILMDVDGNVISMTTNEAGNFFTYAPIAPDPASGAPASYDPDDPLTWRYKAWMKHGGSVRKMVTLAYVGRASSGIPRMACNMHHSGRLSSRGALNTGKFPTLAYSPASNVSFSRHVLPILKNRCKSCHVPASTKPLTSYGDPLVSFDYSGGLDLSAYEGDPASLAWITDVVNVVNPGLSILLSKPSTGSSHAGGSFWEPGDPEYETIRAWIAEGAFDN
jgi:hypothetical protein